MTGFAEATSPSGQVIRIEGEGMAEWTGHGSGFRIPIDFRRGRLSVKNPDEETITCFVALAARLDAQVRGDDGEPYPAQPNATTRAGRRRAGWFRGQPRPKPLARPQVSRSRTREPSISRIRRGGARRADRSLGSASISTPRRAERGSAGQAGVEPGHDSSEIGEVAIVEHVAEDVL